MERYLYLGLDTVVERDHPIISGGSLNLSYIKQAGDTHYNSDGGDQYTGLDRFGRVIDQFWINASNGTTVDRYQYGYNADGEVLSRQNLVDAAMSELYSYDNLGQLTSFQRGSSHSQSWTPDALGNFTNVTTNGTAQTRTANQQNEYTSIQGSGTLSYDANGNLTADGSGNTYVYDAWNRLVAVKNGNTTVASYVYDGLDRIIQVSENHSLTDVYYSSLGQSVEEYQGSTVTAVGVWSPVYVNALVYRAEGNPLQRFYALQDGNWNVTAWVVGGTVVERYAYDPYGVVTVLSPSWVVQTSSSYKIPVGFQGMGYDWFVSMNFADNRVYSPTLMRWLQTDPLGQATGNNGYLMEGNGPTDEVDPSGLSGKANHHPYPLMLGGADEAQPKFDLTEEQHTAAENVLKKYGVGNFNNLKRNDAARAKWAAMSTGQQRAIIIESLRAAGIPESLIQSNIDAIMNAPGTEPGVSHSGLRRAPTTKGKVITKEEICEAQARAGGKGGARAFAGLQAAQVGMDVFIDAAENAPVQGGGKKKDVIEGLWYFKDVGGTFWILEEKGWFSTKYYKVYTKRITQGPMQISISRVEADYFERLGKKLWGYMKFNWSKWEWEFVPGTERKSLPKIIWGETPT